MTARFSQLLTIILWLCVFSTLSAQPFTHNFGHADDIRELHFSQDGALMASLGEDHTLHIRRTSDWRTVAITPGIVLPKNGRQHAAFANNSNALAVASYQQGELRVMIVNSDKQSDRITLQSKLAIPPPYALTAVKDKFYLAIENKVHVYDTQLKSHTTFDLPEALVNTTTELHTTPDGAHLIATNAGLGNTMVCFSLSDNSVISTTETEAKLLKTAVDNEKVITKESDDKSRFYELPKLKGGKIFFYDKALSTEAVALSQNTETLLYGAPEGLGFVANGKQAEQYEIRTAADIRYGWFFKNDTRLATINTKGDRIHVWDLEERDLDTILIHQRHPVKQLAFHPTQPVLYAAYQDYLAEFDLSLPGEVAHRQYQPFDFDYNSFSITEKRILLHGDNTKLQIADWPWMNPVHKISTNEWIENPQLLSDGSRFVFGTEGELVQTRIGAESSDYKIVQADEVGILNIRALSKNRVAVMYDDYVLRVYSETKTLLAEVTDVWPFMLTYDRLRKRLLFTALPKGSLRPGAKRYPTKLLALGLDDYTQSEVSAFKSHIMALPAYASDVSVPIFTADNQLHILDNTTLTETNFKAHFAPVTSVCVSANGRQFAYGDAGGMVGVGAVVATRGGTRAHIKTYLRPTTEGRFLAVNSSGSCGNQSAMQWLQVPAQFEIKGAVAKAEKTTLLPDRFMEKIPTAPLVSTATVGDTVFEIPTSAKLILVGDASQKAAVERSFGALLGRSVRFDFAAVSALSIEEISAALPSPSLNQLTVLYFTDLQSFPEGALERAVAQLKSKLDPKRSRTVILAESQSGPTYNPEATQATLPLVRYILNTHTLGAVAESGSFSPLLKWIYDAPTTKKFDRDFNKKITMKEFEDYLHRMARLSRSEKVRLLTPQTRDLDWRVLMGR